MRIATWFLPFTHEHGVNTPQVRVTGHARKRTTYATTGKRQTSTPNTDSTGLARRRSLNPGLPAQLKSRPNHPDRLSPKGHHLPTLALPEGMQRPGVGKLELLQNLDDGWSRA